MPDSDYNTKKGKFERVLRFVNLDTSKFPNVNALHPDYAGLQITHDISVNLKLIMNGMVDKDEKKQDDGLAYFEFILKSAPPKFEIDGKVVGMYKNPVSTSPYPEWVTFLAQDIVDCIYDDKKMKKLGKCGICGHFYLKKNSRRTRCYSPECEKTFQRFKKQKQREKDPVKYGSTNIVPPKSIVP
jgi:hypothetical protein